MGEGNMKKIIAFLFILLVGGCIQTDSKEFKEIVGEKSLSKIEVIDGRNGKQYSITDEVKQQQFIDLLNEREYTEMKHHEKTKGYIYHAILSSDDKSFSITFLGDEIEINDIYYSLDKSISEKDISSILE